MMRKILSVIVLALVVLMVVPVHTEAKVVTTQLPLDIEYVRLNGDKLHENGQTVNPTVIDDLEREQSLSVTVSVANNGVDIQSTVDENGDGVVDANDIKHIAVELTDVNVYASIEGYDQHPGYITGAEEDLEEDLADGHAQTFKFSLDLPSDLDQGDYVLLVRAQGTIKNFDEAIAEGASFDHSRQTKIKEYAITVDAKDHSMTIKDVIFAPASTVKAGTSLLTKVRVMNSGNQDDTEGVQVKVTIPQLGLEATDWLEELDEEESSSSEQLWVIIPKCTAAGTYDVNVDVWFEDGDHKVSTTRQITVYENENCVVGQEETPAPQETTVLTVGTSTQNVVKGEAGVVYPVTISNQGSAAKTYVLNVDGYQSWAQTSVSPSNVLVVNPGQATAAYVHVSALDGASAGEHMFSLAVNSGVETLEQFVVKANVQEGSVEKAPAEKEGSSTTQVLTIVLIVLIVVLVLLGLIIGFSKLRGKDEDLDEDDEQTYY